MKKTMILLGAAALAIWSADHADAASTRPANGQANCPVTAAGPGQCQTITHPPRARLRAHIAHEPSIYLLLLVAVGLLSLRMHPSAGSEKFSM